MDGLDMRCQCCGRAARDLVDGLPFSVGPEGFVALCKLCTGLQEAGMLRREVHAGGVVRYRRWVFEWTPGDLMPEVVQPV